MHAVKRARLQKGWTLTELSARSGLDRHTIGLIEEERRSPSAPTVARLAAALGLPVEDVAEGGTGPCRGQAG